MYDFSRRKVCFFPKIAEKRRFYKDLTNRAFPYIFLTKGIYVSSIRTYTASGRQADVFLLYISNFFFLFFPLLFFFLSFFLFFFFQTGGRRRGRPAYEFFPYLYIRKDFFFIFSFSISFFLLESREKPEVPAFVFRQIIYKKKKFSEVPCFWIFSHVSKSFSDILDVDSRTDRTTMIWNSGLG